MHRTLNILPVLSILLLGLLCLQSCKDDDANNNCSFNARLISPENNNAQFASGEDIPLDVEFTACTPIQSYLVSVRNRTSDELVFVQSEFTNEDLFEINLVLNLEVSANTPMDIEIRAEDSEGNQIEETIGTFELTPPIGNIVSLRFNLMYQGETLLLNQDYIYPTGEQFEFTRFDMYVTCLLYTSPSPRDRG